MRLLYGMRKMEQGFQFLDLLFFGAIAVFVLLRLRSVLGTRTGREKRPEDILQRRLGAADAAANAPAGPVAALANHDERAAALEPKLAQALAEISHADPGFDSVSFLQGARQAYEMIVTAFANGDRGSLRGMVGEEVLANFSAAIAAREAARQTMQTKLTAIRQARLATRRCAAKSLK